MNSFLNGYRVQRLQQRSHFLRFSIGVEWSDAWSRLGLSTGACLGGSEWGGCQVGFVGHGEGTEPGSGVRMWLGGLG